jgi:hypothetical protein
MQQGTVDLRAIVGATLCANELIGRQDRRAPAYRIGDQIVCVLDHHFAPAAALHFLCASAALLRSVLPPLM